MARRAPRARRASGATDPRWACSRAARDGALHELGKPGLGARLHVRGQRPARLLRDRQHVGGQHLAALIERREVLEEAVARRGDAGSVSAISRQRARRRAPPRARPAARGTCTGTGHPLAHAAEPEAERGRQRHGDAAAPGQRIGGALHGLAQRPSHRASVAWYTRTGTAGTILLGHARPCRPRRRASAASSSQRKLVTPAGTTTSQPTACAWPGASGRLAAIERRAEARHRARDGHVHRRGRSRCAA